MKTLPFMKSYRDALNRIPDPEIRWRAFEFIQDYAFYDMEPDEDAVKASCKEYAVAVLIALDLIRPLIDKRKAAADAHREAGKAGGRPAKEETKITKENQNSKNKPSSKDMDMEMDNMEDGKGNGKKNSISATADNVLNHLNEIAGRHFRHNDGNRKYILARLREGYTYAECISVIDRMVMRWANTDMDAYLRPKTLFSAANFDGYLNMPADPGKHPPAGKKNAFHNLQERNLDYDAILMAEDAERARQEVVANA